VPRVVLLPTMFMTSYLLINRFILFCPIIHVMEKPIPVISSLKQLKSYMLNHKEKCLCLYLADKTRAQWNRSTSRKYMNALHPELVYLPVNVRKGEVECLKKLYRLADDPRIIAINHTSPHKSNPVLKRLCKTGGNVDFIIRDSKGRWKPYDLNGPSFVDWFRSEIGSFTDRTFIVLGVGGAGRAIADELGKHKPKELIMIDKNRKVMSIAKVKSSLVLVNCTGKTVKGLASFLSSHKGIFIDIRPGLHLPIVERAKSLGWKAYTGHGMNARNDYIMMRLIFRRMGKKPIAYAKFKKLVASCS
jgi:shikimate 5-dehydrogenase